MITAGFPDRLGPMTDRLAIYEKWVDAAKDDYRILAKYPKEEKFILAAQTRAAILDVGALIQNTNGEISTDKKLVGADRIDLQIARVKSLWRLALEFGYISPKTFGLVTDRYIEIGRMLGGWKKSFVDKPLRFGR